MEASQIGQARISSGENTLSHPHSNAQPQASFSHALFSSKVVEQTDLQGTPERGVIFPPGSNTFCSVSENARESLPPVGRDIVIMLNSSGLSAIKLPNVHPVTKENLNQFQTFALFTETPAEELLKIWRGHSATPPEQSANASSVRRHRILYLPHASRLMSPDQKNQLTEALQHASQPMSTSDDLIRVKHDGQEYRVPVIFVDGTPHFFDVETAKSYALGQTDLLLPYEVTDQILGYLPKSKQRARMAMANVNIPDLLKPENAELLLPEGVTKGLSAEDKTALVQAQRQDLFARHLASLWHEVHRQPNVHSQADAARQMIALYGTLVPALEPEQIEQFFKLPWYALHESKGTLPVDQQRAVLQNFNDTLRLKFPPSIVGLALMALSHHVFKALPDVGVEFSKLLKDHLDHDLRQWDMYRQLEPDLALEQRVYMREQMTLTPPNFDILVTALLHKNDKKTSPDLIEMAFDQLTKDPTGLLINERGLTPQGLKYVEKLADAIPKLDEDAQIKVIEFFKTYAMGSELPGEQKNALVVALLKQIPDLPDTAITRTVGSIVTYMTDGILQMVTSRSLIFDLALEYTADIHPFDTMPIARSLVGLLPRLTPEERQRAIFTRFSGIMEADRAGGVLKCFTRTCDSSIPSLLSRNDEAGALALYRNGLEVTEALLDHFDCVKGTRAIRFMTLMWNMSSHENRFSALYEKTVDQRLKLWDKLFHKLSEEHASGRVLRDDDKNYVIGALRDQLKQHPEERRNDIRIRLSTAILRGNLDPTFQRALLASLK